MTTLQRALIAIIVTSLVRSRLNPKAWRTIHLLAYVSWPVAWLHGFTAATDMRHGWMLALAVADLLLVAAAVLWRVAAAARDIPRAQRVGILMEAVHRPANRRRTPAGPR